MYIQVNIYAQTDILPMHAVILSCTQLSTHSKKRRAMEQAAPESDKGRDVRPTVAQHMHGVPTLEPPVNSNSPQTILHCGRCCMPQTYCTHPTRTLHIPQHHNRAKRSLQRHVHGGVLKRELSSETCRLAVPCTGVTILRWSLCASRVGPLVNRLQHPFKGGPYFLLEKVRAHHRRSLSHISVRHGEGS